MTALERACIAAMTLIATGAVLMGVLACLATYGA